MRKVNILLMIAALVIAATVSSAAADDAGNVRSDSQISASGTPTFATFDVPGAAGVPGAAVTIPMKFAYARGYEYGIVGTYADDTSRLHGFWSGPPVRTIDFTELGTNTIVTAGDFDSSKFGYEEHFWGGQDTDGTSCLNPGTGVCRAFVYRSNFSDAKGYELFEIRYPNSLSTMVFSSRNWCCGIYTFVGAYASQDGTVHGWQFVVPLGYRTIDPPDAVFSFATDTNFNASAVVGRWDTPDGATHGYLKIGDNYTTIDVPGAISTVAWGLAPAGALYPQTIVGEYTDSDGVVHGFRTPDGGLTFEPIDFPNAIATRCRGVSGNRVLGSYIDSEGVEHGFIATF